MVMVSLPPPDWPLLGFYGAMCVVYVVYGFVWLVISAMRWRELLRVQYWIGAVIFLGENPSFLLGVVCLLYKGIKRGYYTYSHLRYFM